MANRKQKTAGKPSKKKNTTAAAAGAPSQAGDVDDITVILPPPRNEDDTDQTDDGASNSSSIKKRQDRKLTDQQEVDMLEFLRTNICMWDMKDIDYRNAQKKQSLWESLATTMGGDLTHTHLKAAFKNLRNWNTKLDKECSKSGSAPRVMTHRDLQVQERMQFMKATVKHRPAPLSSATGRGPDETRDTIVTLDDDALEPPKKRPASSASTSADADGLDTLQTVLDRQNEKLQTMVTNFNSPAEVVDLDDPQSASRSIQKSYCNYVSSCVMTYNEEEFDDFQSAFTQIHEQFKTARRAKVKRQQAIAEQAGQNTRYTYPTTLMSPSPQYQLDPAHWATQPPGQLQAASLYSSQSQEFQGQYQRMMTPRPQTLQARPIPVIQTLQPPMTVLPPATTDMPTIRRLTSTPKRDAPPTSAEMLNLSDFVNRSTTTNPAGDDSQDLCLGRLQDE